MKSHCKNALFLHLLQIIFAPPPPVYVMVHFCMFEAANNFVVFSPATKNAGILHFI